VIRRDNGLTAEAYRPMTDLHPDDTEEVLEALRDEGIAAYTEPLEPEPGDARPDDPQDDGSADRLWVDATATLRTRRVLRDLFDDGPRERDREPQGPDKLPKPEQPRTKEAAPDDDAVWAQIVAGFDTEVSDPVPRWPVAEELDSPGPRADTAGSKVSRGPDGSFLVVPLDPGPRDWSPEDPDAPGAAQPDKAPDTPEDRYVPPEPPPLPKTDSVTKAAWAALLGGPLVLLASVLLDREVGPWTMFFAFTAFVGGFVTLVARMRREDDDHDPDDGAVV
jgi:hypothetical protein